MTEKITLELTIEELKLLDNCVGRYDNTAVLKDKIKDAYPLPEMSKHYEGTYDIVSYNDEIYYRLKQQSHHILWFKQKKDELNSLMPVSITDKETERLLEGLFFNDVRNGNCNEPKPITPLDEVVERLVKKHQAQKLYNRLYYEWGYDKGDCEFLVSLVEDWILDEQSSAGSQNVNTELLVEGFNDAIRKMKQMLR